MALSNSASLRRSPDLVLGLLALFLLGLGLLSLYSLGHRTGESFLRKQLAMAAIGMIPFLLFFLVDPRVWRRLSWGLYGLTIALLGSVLVFGQVVNGARRWIDFGFVQFQPSELAKLLTILTLGAFLATRAAVISKPSTFLLSFVHVAVPALLIARQPHYGGALVIFIVWLGMCLVAGVPGRYLLAALCVICVGAVFAARVPGVLKSYHKKRIQVLRGRNIQGANFQQERARAALANGGILGTGLFKGTHRLPEQENDFIFTVLGEELGLVGSALVLGAFGLFFARAWRVVSGAIDPYLRIVGAGVLLMLAMHAVINVAMVVQILPVIGLWLPFMSAGGTALWLCMASVGLLLRIASQP